MSSHHLYSNALNLLGDERSKADFGSNPRVHRKMIMKSDINPGACVFCNSKHDLRSMHMNYQLNGILENYTEMLLSCFNLRLVSLNKTDTESEICNTCVTNLRDALIFRKKVESVNETLNGHNLDSNKKQIKIKKLIISEHSCKKRKAKKVKNHKKDLKEKLKTELKFNKHNIKKEINLTNEASDIPLINFNSDHESIPYCDNLKEKLKNELKFNKHKIKKEIDLTNEASDIPFVNFNSDHESIPNYDLGITYEDIKPKLVILSEKDNCGIPRLDSFALVCPICGESFGVHASLRKHYPIHFPNFLCDICGQAFLNKVSLVRHVSIHSDQRHPCKMCKRTYANRGALLQHVRKFHRGEKNYCCPVCPERFHDYSHKNRHQFEVHGMPCRTYKCETCNRVFYRNSKLSEHVKRLHLKLKNYLCEMCDKEFCTKGELTMHMLRHSGDKTFACEKCGKSFARKKTLTEHLKIHANLRAHKCTLCDKAFVQKCTLKGHMRTHQKCGV